MISIECFNGLPEKYESFLVERYDSFMTTCRYVEINHPTCDFYYMLVYKSNTLVDVLIFGNKGNTSKCMNMLVEIDEDIITKCIKSIFERYPNIKRIQIDASYKSYSLKKSFLYSSCNDHIINLPSTMDEYYSELGCKTRKHIKQRNAKLLKEFSNVSFTVKSRTEIKQKTINKIILMNIDRMIHKGIIPGKSDSDKNHYFQYSQHYGCVASIEINGIMVAGCIASILNKRIYLIVIAHDNNYSKYHVGELCMTYMIQTSIEMGLTKAHFLWGENEYKARLLANPYPLFSYFVYRNYSVNYVCCRLKAAYSRIVVCFRLSKCSKPLRDIIKKFRKRKCHS